MRQLTNREKAAIAEELGHTRLRVEETVSRRRWRATCDCGWNAGLRFTTRATAAEAVSHGVWHLNQVIEAHRGSNVNGGVSVTAQEKIHL